MFRFLVLFGCLLIASSAESNATDKIKVGIYSYGEGDSCLIKAFVLSSEGFYSKSTTIINSCQECHAENPLPHYYCKMVIYKNSFWSGDLLKAAKTLKDISESKFVIESSHESTIANLTNTASILSKSSVHHSPESLLAYYDETSFVIEDKNRMVDTAALFNSSSRCDKRYSANVADALGKDIKLDVCMNSIDGDIIPTVESNKSYVIGLINLLKYDRIVFSRTNLSNLKSYKMMRDGNIIFFIDKMKIKKQVSIANLCIDTGAKSTLLTPKGYKKIRDSLRDVEFKKLTIEGIGGGSSALVKIIPSISIITDNREIKLKNVPALLKVAPFPHCDVVLGMDALFNTLHSIDFKNSLITLIAESH